MRHRQERTSEGATTRLTALFLLPLALAGCARTPADAPDPRGDRELRTTVTSFEVSGTSVDEVRILVPADAATGTPVCDGPLSFRGQVRYAFRWSDDDGKVVRLVYTFFDEEGVPRKYSDVRGAATNVRSPASQPGTFILIDLPGGPALINNQGEGGGEGYRVPVADALDAAVLDHPRRWIRRLQEECMGGQASP